MRRRRGGSGRSGCRIRRLGKWFVSKKGLLMSNQLVYVVFDTNAYRECAHGLIPAAAEQEIMKLRAHEDKVGAKAIASPYVIGELLAHLADPNDPAYADCLGAICGLQRHCEEDATAGVIRVLGDVESQLVQHLYGVTLPGHEQFTQLLTRICYLVQRDPADSNLAQIRPDLIKIKDWVGQVEDQFVIDVQNSVGRGADPNATGWEPLQGDQNKRRLILKYLDSQQALRNMASALVVKAMTQAGVSFEEELDFDKKVDAVLASYDAPLRLYREIARRIVTTGCDLTKNNRPNW